MKEYKNIGYFSWFKTNFWQWFISSLFIYPFFRKIFTEDSFVSRVCCGSDKYAPFIFEVLIFLPFLILLKYLLSKVNSLLHDVHLKQKAVLVLYMLLVIYCGFIYVPWLGSSEDHTAQYLVYNPIWTSPESIVASTDDLVRLDVSRLMIEFLVLTIIAASAIKFLRVQKSE